MLKKMFIGAITMLFMVSLLVTPAYADESDDDGDGSEATEVVNNEETADDTEEDDDPEETDEDDGEEEESAYPVKGAKVWVEATAYSAYDPGNSHYTAMGTRLRHGVIAVDPSFIPLGTRVFIPDYGEAVAEDVGGAIQGNIIDIAFDSHEEALAFGRQELEITIIEYP